MASLPGTLWTGLLCELYLHRGIMLYDGRFPTTFLGTQGGYQCSNCQGDEEIKSMKDISKPPSVMDHIHYLSTDKVQGGE